MNKVYGSKDFCFCTLALGEKYQSLAQDLALDLQKYAPGVKIVVGTDNPKQFKNCDNVMSFQQKQTGILHCFNDKRFVIEKSLLYFNAAIYLDADTKIISQINQPLVIFPGITGYTQNMIAHITKYSPENLDRINRVASKLNILIEQVNWIGESLFIVAKDEGKEKEFFKIWGLLARYLEMKGIHSGEGNIMGLAATKVGWEAQSSEALIAIDKSRKHLDAFKTGKKLNFMEKFKKVLEYHYRLNKNRLIALKNFDFYYR